MHLFFLSGLECFLFSCCLAGCELLGPCTVKRCLRSHLCACCTITHPLSSLRLNCRVRAESQPRHSWLTVVVRLLPTPIYKKCRSALLRLLSREAPLSTPRLLVLCDCNLCVFGGALRVPCSPLSKEFYQPPHTRFPWTNNQVADLLLFPSRWCLSDREGQHTHHAHMQKTYALACKCGFVFSRKKSKKWALLSVHLSHWNWRWRNNHWEEVIQFPL